MDCNTDSNLKSNIINCWDFKHNTTNGLFEQLSNNPPYFSTLNVIFKFACIALMLAILFNFPAFTIGKMNINTI